MDSCVLKYVCVFTLFLSTSAEQSMDESNGRYLVFEAVQGSIAKLLCNVTPPVADDSVTLVIWYREGHSKPIYSVDIRNADMIKANHWIAENLKDRASFIVDSTMEKTAVLQIKASKSTDSGLYRCRVDFLKNPTRNSMVQLKIIVPPEKLVILDDTGNHIPHYILGPFNEGSSINITCVSTGGRPLPNVTWWTENSLLSKMSTILSERRVSNVLHIERLERKHLNQVLTCQAANNNLTSPITSAVTVDLNLKPLTVRLQGDRRPLSANTSYKLECVVTGSRPAPTITWWKGSTSMANIHDETAADGNVTVSTLTFTPTIEDRGKFLSCRAEQSLIPESGMEDGWKLDIYHVPVINLEFGTNSNSSTVSEGADVYFECNIKSNPWVYRVSWKHNDNILSNNIAEGIIISNQSLVLQNLSRSRSGTYICVGSNREGDGESNAVQLDVKFAPICRPGQRKIYSLARHETKGIICEVEANPTEVSYIWKFNVSFGELLDIPESQIINDRAWSTAHYTPMTEKDYGSLLCWATNEIGHQRDPCVYTITPAGEPEPPANCSISNQTSTSFQLECISGLNVQMDEMYILEVYANGRTRNPKIYQAKFPIFIVRDLLPGMVYNGFLVAQNNKGKSNATVFQVYTLRSPEKQTDLSLAYGPVVKDIRPFVGVLLGIVGSIFFVALIIVIIVRMRGSSGRDRINFVQQINISNEQHSNQSIHRIGTLRGSCQRLNTDNNDMNPDVIPQDEYDEDEWISTGKGTGRTLIFTTTEPARQGESITIKKNTPAILTQQNSICNEDPYLTHQCNISYNNDEFSSTRLSGKVDIVNAAFKIPQVQSMSFAGGTIIRPRIVDIIQSQLPQRISSTQYPICNTVTSPSLVIQPTSSFDPQRSGALTNDDITSGEYFLTSLNPVSFPVSSGPKYL